MLKGFYFKKLHLTKKNPNKTSTHWKILTKNSMSAGQFLWGIISIRDKKKLFEVKISENHF